MWEFPTFQTKGNIRHIFLFYFIFKRTNVDRIGNKAYK